MTPKWRARIAAAVGAGAAVALASLGMMPGPAEAGSFVSVSGSGSSWASVAIDQWAQDVRPNGIVVNYNPDGSAAGRGDYMANQDDFAGSDPPFRNGQDKLGGTGAEHPSQGYSYIPDTAGGTALIYHITVGGKLITNLRLDPKTIFDIFTGKVTNWEDKEITHIYGAQLPNLPITPVIRSADLKSLPDTASEVRELAGRARERKLKPEEYMGATFSISNLGMFGIDEFTAVINPPEGAILAVGAMTEKPVARDGEVVVRQMMRVTMSCDHRVVDGAVGAQFLQTFKQILENPLYLFLGS